MNVDLDSFYELAELKVGMSSGTYGLLKIINFETFKLWLFYKGDFSIKMGIFGAEKTPFFKNASIKNGPNLIFFIYDFE